MLPVLVAGTAALAAICSQVLSSLNNNNNNNNNNNINNVDNFEISKPAALEISNPIFAEILQEQPQVQLDKHIDALFVSHGVEEEPPIAEEPNKKREIHEISDIATVANGENWLILSHVPWCPKSQALLEHFVEHYAEVKSENIKLATANVHEHPELVYHLQLREYPSLTLVTEDSRIRPWPFVARKMNADILAFLENSQWRYIPVYQRLQTEPIHPFYRFQISLFNSLMQRVMYLQPLVFAFIQANRQMTATALALLATLIITIRKLTK